MPRLLTAVAVLAIALLVPAVAVGQERTVVVRGAVTQLVPNDAASLSFSVSKERRSRGAALRVVSARLRAVIAAVQTVPGVGPGDITTGQISVRKLIRPNRTLYRASEGISVILHQPERAGEMVSAAIAAGATGTRGPNFFAANPDLAYNSALLAAFDQARAKASALAARAGAVLGPVISIEEGVEISVTPASPPTTKDTAAAEPTPPVKPGTSTVTATVRAVFALQ